VENADDMPMPNLVARAGALDFGSNPKQYGFPVARIARDGDRCTIYGAAEGEPDQINRIVVEPCLERSAVP
jgi:hypothetical protein